MTTSTGNRPGFADQRRRARGARPTLGLVTAVLLSTWVAPEARSEGSAGILEATGLRGGLIVHLGCGDGRLTATMRGNDRCLVHGLVVDGNKVTEAREHIRSLGLYGPVSVDTFDGEHLPYADNLVNAVVVSDAGRVSKDEMLRVLAPGGAMWTKRNGTWISTVKPRPSEIDEWTHFLHDASGNAVSKDRRVAPPKRLQWVAAPRWCRSHEFPTSLHAAVSAGGRLFYILDEGPLGVYRNLPQHCSLIARDASNGLLLWKRPMKEWGHRYGTGLGDRWHIHHTLPRRLVAHGERVYVTSRFRDSPVSVVDASTGAILTPAIEGTEGADELLHDGGILVVRMTGQSPGATKLITQEDLGGSLAAFDAGTGRRLWQKEKARVAPYALALKDNRVVYHNLAELVCLDAKTGHELWRVPNRAGRIPGAGSTLVLDDGVVLYHSFARAGQKKTGQRRRGFVTALTALSVEDGRVLWTSQGGIGWAGACTQPTDLFVANNLVWCGQSREGRDLRTGEVKQKLDLGKLISQGHHPRCYRSKATERFLIWPKRGAEFVDLEGGEHMRHDWLRAPCFTGVLPANGLLYVPPSQCFCYPGVKLTGFLALEGGAGVVWSEGSGGRLQHGPAYGRVDDRPSGAGNPGNWPMYRHDPLRSGATTVAVPAELGKLWEVKLSYRAAQPVVVGDRLFLAETDAHRIVCLEAGTGRPVWTHVAGGRIDSAPTIHDGLVLFGSADGSAYCLRSSDGELVWRFRAAPEERRVVSHGQLESAWPVHGSLLVEGGVVYFAAGRSSFLDGGILVYGLDPGTGKVLHRRHLEGPWPDIKTESGGPFAMEGARSDLLVSDGTCLYMQRIKLDAALNRLETPQLTSLGDLDMGGLHLLATGGFLDDSGFDRIFWMHTTRWPGFHFTVQAPKSGQLIVFDDDTTYAIKFFYRRHALSPGFVPAEEGFLLFADDSDNEPILVDPKQGPKAIEWLPVSARTKGRYDIASKAVGVEKGVGFTRARPAKWQRMTRVRARAMMLAGDRLFVAGPPDVVEPEDPYAAFEGRKGAVLQVFSASDGALLKEHPLDSPPVFDGRGAAHGRLYLSTEDGRILCLAARRE